MKKGELYQFYYKVVHKLWGSVFTVNLGYGSAMNTKRIALLITFSSYDKSLAAWSLLVRFVLLSTCVTALRVCQLRCLCAYTEGCGCVLLLPTDGLLDLR